MDHRLLRNISVATSALASALAFVAAGFSFYTGNVWDGSIHFIAGLALGFAGALHHHRKISNPSGLTG